MVGTQVSAREFFRSAYENRYTWDHNFPGYTADVTFISGDTTVTAKAHVSADLKAEVTDIEDEAAQKAIQYQLWEVAIHRIRRAFEDTHGDNTFTYGKTLDDGSVEIFMGGKAEGDRYHVRDNEVSMVHRHIHGTVVTIHTFSSHDTGEGYLSHRYDSVYHDPATGDQKGGRSVFEDNYEKVGDYVILTERKIQTETEKGPVEQIFRFSNISLL
ncbi:DUF3386 domain-containing protein [Oscillatoria sp. CS-180]|uniref:DUF3386 domain-containing protein n=1 Tax=Oscillatoria sp. CS-180 TaxID=3021720 RepID=UPI00232B7BEA|nr:DUF3386 domain-containing protein [Oscillatoria sp. CS-180]MDB9524908.1 DUF3386 domain-containing protein [Oscillatoria sp. CS-180]